ncbi:MAG: hypothetical protein GJV46_00255 [Geobacter sp.]|nr:hypothetical protein [Geobacter sp.]
MAKIGKGIVAALVLGILVAGLGGCKKKEGPLERAGREMDKAAEKAGQQVEKVGDKIKDAAKDLKK